jgi:hypothetical protein
LSVESVEWQSTRHTLVDANRSVQALLLLNLFHTPDTVNQSCTAPRARELPVSACGDPDDRHFDQQFHQPELKRRS